MKCEAFNEKSGKRCRKNAVQGGSWCAQHLPHLQDVEFHSPSQHIVDEMIDITTTNKETPKPMPTLNPMQRFIAWMDTESETHTWCCDYHRNIVCEMRKANSLSASQLEYARLIVKGQARHSNSKDPMATDNKIYKIKCAKGRCDNILEGTRHHIVKELNRHCDEHRH